MSDLNIPLMTGHHAPHAAGHDDHGGLAKYWIVFGALCLLTGMSFFTYSRFWPIPNEHVKWAFMMAVSCTKAMLVILFFMHIKYEANWKYVLTIPAGMMSIFLMLMLVPDIGMRGRWASEERQKHMALPIVHEAGDSKTGDSKTGDSKTGESGKSSQETKTTPTR